MQVQLWISNYFLKGYLRTIELASVLFRDFLIVPRALNLRSYQR